jgi:hypothetical protein
MPLPFKHKIKNKVTQSHTTGLKPVPEPRPRGNKRARVDILRIKSDISSLSDNYTDQEIIYTLKLNHQTYYRLKGELYQEAKEIWRQTYKESQELRILHTISAIHLSLRINKEIATDKDIDPKIRLEAAEALVETEMKFLQLLHDINENNNSNDKTPHDEEELYSKPEWYDEKKEKIWDSMTIPEKKDRIWKERLR